MQKCFCRYFGLSFSKRALLRPLLPFMTLTVWVIFYMMTRYVLGKNAFWSLFVSFHYSCHNDKSWAVNLGCIYSVTISNGQYNRNCGGFLFEDRGLRFHCRFYLKLVTPIPMIAFSPSWVGQANRDAVLFALREKESMPRCLSSL